MAWLPTITLPTQQAKNLVTSIVDAAKSVLPAFGKATSIAAHATPLAATTAAAAVPAVASGLLANETVKMVLWGAKLPFKAIEFCFHRMPVISSTVGLLAGLATFAGVSSYFSNKTRHSAAENTQAQAMAEVSAAQQKYMNSVTPEEHARMELLMRSKGQMAEGVMASKQDAAIAPNQPAA
jgi:hypothetical protein